MKSLYDIYAPAKLNLFLHVVGRRSDGYHLLQSVFMLIDWCDRLHFERRSDGKISREDLLTPLPADDLVLRAASALQAQSGCPLGVHIGIEKHIPAQAGLGGGSSDAASTLLALNHLWGLGYSLEELVKIGLRLGADVPFFLAGRNAWVEGIGDKLTPVHVPDGRFLVVKPAQGLPTGTIFSDPALRRNSETAIISGFAADAFGFGRNDLQSVAERLCPGVTQALEWLASLGLSGRMTGSGSAVFAQVQHDLALKDVPAEFRVRLCSGLAVHPLVGWAASDSLSVDGL